MTLFRLHPVWFQPRATHGWFRAPWLSGAGVNVRGLRRFWLLPLLLLGYHPGALAQPRVNLEEQTLSIVESAPCLLWSLEHDILVAAGPAGVIEIPRPPDGWYLILTFYGPGRPAVWPLMVGLPAQRELWAALVGLRFAQPPSPPTPACPF